MGPITGLVIPWFRAYFIGFASERLVGIIIPKKLKKASHFTWVGNCGSERIWTLHVQYPLSLDSDAALESSWQQLQICATLFIFKKLHLRCLNSLRSLRKREDLNLRTSFLVDGFRNRCLQPLSHASRPGEYIIYVEFLCWNIFYYFR